MKSYDVGPAETSVLSLRNLHHKLSSYKLSPWDGFKPLKIFTFSSGDVSGSWKFKYLKSILVSKYGETLDSVKTFWEKHSINTKKNAA